MPKPKKGEKEKDFIARCIPIVIEDETAEDQEQAIAVCYSMWREEHPESKAIYGDELSKQDELREIEMAFDHTFPCNEAAQPMGSFYPWIVATYDALLIVELSGKYYKVSYSREGDNIVFSPFVEWEEVQKDEEWITKARNYRIKAARIKAVGDWELDVLAIPYGGPNKGRDAEGEYFSEETNLYLDKFNSPIVSYYHGFDPDGYPQGNPEEIGEVLSRENKSDGLWVRVLLDKASEYAKRVWEAAKEGLARASSGTIEHIRRVTRDGLITHWPFVELALFDTEGHRQPANDYAVALPVLKAAYKQAGKDWPELPEDETDLTLVQLKGRAFLLEE